MRTFATLLAAAAIAAFGFTGPASAGVLDAPTGLSCVLQNSDGDYFVDWSAVTGAEKYAVAIECAETASFEVDTGEFDTGTSECGEVTGVACAGLTATDILIDVDLIVDAFAVNPDTGDSCRVRVRALHSGKGKGPQNKIDNAGAKVHGEASLACPVYP